jgi:hypothetical protein
MNALPSPSLLCARLLGSLCLGSRPSSANAGRLLLGCGAETFIVSPLVTTALWREQYPAVSESPWVLCWSSGDFLSGVLWGSVHVATPVVVTGVIGLLLENLGETNDSTPLYASTSIAHFPSVSLMSLV